MRAIILGPHGPALSQVAIPEVGPSQVRIKVHACALNRADLFMAEGRRHGDSGGPGTILGLEWSGIVDAIGPEVPSHVRVGQRVMGSGRGAFADYTVADWGRVLPAPQHIEDPGAAAALPIALQTMHDALVTRAQLTADQAVLIHGASTGVGLMAAKIARFLNARWLGGSSTNADKRDRLRQLGFDEVVDPNAADWSKVILDATGGTGADVVVDMLAGHTFNATLAATAIEGRIVNVGRLAGRTGNFDFDLHALRRVQYIGVTFRTRTQEEVRKITASMLRDLAEPLNGGRLQLPIDRCFPVEQASEALRYMKTNRHFGKIILRVD